MTLKTKYNAILNKNCRAQIRKKIAETFGVSSPTIFNWLSGRSVPPIRYRAAIAEIMGTDVSELFPTTTNNHSELTY
jgi:transcriptional regulator with XRE-family HTH domain